MAGHVVVDAGPLIHLTQADALHLLHEFQIVTPLQRGSPRLQPWEEARSIRPIRA